MHDPKKVLEICKKATPGPWVPALSEGDCGVSPEQCPRKLLYCDDDCPQCEHWEIYQGAWVEGPEYIDCGDYSYFTDDDARFVALAHEALPYWIERCRHLEAVAEAAINLLDSHKRMRNGFPLDFEEKILIEELTELTLAAAGYGGDE
jgi:hypothetical protein